MFNENLFTGAGMVSGRHGSFPRFSPESLGEVWSDKIVNEAAAVDGVRLFPTAAELRQRGVDIDLLAACLQEKLIVCKEFNETVETASAEQINTALEHLLEGSDAHRAHPHDSLDRAMHIQGCCGCKCAV